MQKDRSRHILGYIVTLNTLGSDPGFFVILDLMFRDLWPFLLMIMNTINYDKINTAPTDRIVWLFREYFVCPSRAVNFFFDHCIITAQATHHILTPSKLQYVRSGDKINTAPTDRIVWLFREYFVCPSRAVNFFFDHCIITAQATHHILTPSKLQYVRSGVCWQGPELLRQFRKVIHVDLFQLILHSKSDSWLSNCI